MSYITDKEFHKQFAKVACEWSAEEELQDAFPGFIMKLFFNKLSNDEIEESLQGLGSNDDSIDSFWVDPDDRVIHIVQFKCSTNCNNIQNMNKEDAAYFADVPNKLSNAEYVSTRKNKRIKIIAEEYQKLIIRNYKVLNHFFYLGYISKDIMNLYPRIEFYDLELIKNSFNLYNSANNPIDPEECDVVIDYSDSPQIIDYHPVKKYRTIIALLTGLELVNLRKKYHYNLFDRNVRYYLGDTNPVNKNMIETANRDDGRHAEFYYYNNGITISCAKCQRKDLDNDKIRLRLEKPQIINGAQTINSLHDAYDKKIKQLSTKEMDDRVVATKADEHFKKILVLCRIVESTKGDDNVSKFADHLKTYTNSQSTIKITDFYSNRPEQQELQAKLAGYGIFYEIKRGERDYLKNNKNQLHDRLKKRFVDFASDVKINLEDLAALYQSYKGKPDQAGDKKFFSDEKRYEELFGNKRSDIDDQKVKDIVLAIIIFNNVDIYVKSYRKISRVINTLAREPHNNTMNNKLEKYLSESDSDFLNDPLRKDLRICKDYSNDSQTVLCGFRRYKLLSNGKYFIIALIHNILIEYDYKEVLMKEIKLGQQLTGFEKLIRMIVKELLGDIVKFIQNTYAKHQDKKSESAFFKDPYVFDDIKKEINLAKYENENKWLFCFLSG